MATERARTHEERRRTVMERRRTLRERGRPVTFRRRSSAERAHTAMDDARTRTERGHTLAEPPRTVTERARTDTISTRATLVIPRTYEKSTSFVREISRIGLPRYPSFSEGTRSLRERASSRGNSAKAGPVLPQREKRKDTHD
jgi:hypothetical protein